MPPSLLIEHDNGVALDGHRWSRPLRAIRAVDLETLIGIKAATGRARDKLVLPILLALRDRSG